MSMLSIGLVVWVLFGAVAILMVRYSRKRRYSEVDTYFMAAFLRTYSDMDVAVGYCM